MVPDFLFLLAKKVASVLVFHVMHKQTHFALTTHLTDLNHLLLVVFLFLVFLIHHHDEFKSFILASLQNDRLD